MRAELGPAEMAGHLKRRKEIWEEREKKVGQVDPPSGQKKGFAKDTEDKTGTPKRTTNRAVARAEAVPADVLGKIKGTELDTGQRAMAVAMIYPNPEKGGRGKITS